MKFQSLVRSCLLVALSFVLIATSFVLSPSPSLAQSHNTFNIQQSPTQPTMTILILDMSGSMSTNDPNGLRCSAANAYIDLSGPGNFIGLINLAGNATRGGPNNFELAQNWSNPIEAATPTQRQALQNTIKEKSQSCRSNGSTPTYDALNKALQMLKTASQGRQLAGFVVLLTDGAPDPNTKEQVEAIQKDLLPEFKRNAWPVDTIALGADNYLPQGSPFRSFHAFLGGVANATSGKFYSDANGVVSGRPSPINIAPFFVDIFARRNNRTIGDDIGLTQLNNQTVSRAFEVTNYTDNLDVVVVKDQAGSKVTLKDPGGREVKTQSGVFVSTSDPYYAVYSIERPQQGSWTIDVNGSGQFLLKSLKVSNVGLSNLNFSQLDLTSTENSALALGQPVEIKTNLTYQGEPVTDKSFAVNGRITYNGVLGRYAQNFTLNSERTPGTYVGNVVIPLNAPPGSYDVTVNAYTVSQAQPIASQLRSVRIEVFPEPLLRPSPSQEPTRERINLNIVRWDPVIQLIYGLPIAPVQWLSQWPLQGLPARSEAEMAGQLVLRDQPYTNAQIQATISAPGSSNASPVTVTNEGGGRFRLPLQAFENGTYTVNFQTSGSFADSHGDFGTTRRTAQVNLVAPSLFQTFYAWGVTGLYLFTLFALFLLGRFLFLPKPFGGALVNQDGETIGSINFNRARRGLFSALRHPNMLRSLQAGMPAGLLFHFKRGKGIEVQPDGRTNSNWQQGDGSPLPRTAQELSEVRYHPQHLDEDDRDGSTPVTYQIKSQLSTPSSVSDDGISDVYREDMDSKPTRKKEKPTKRKKQVQVDDDYDW